jgi:hypothetical protein
VNRDYFERFLFAQCRQDRWHSAREHCLAGARRADQENIVTAGRGNLERAFGRLLPNDVGEVRGIVNRS